MVYEVIESELQVFATEWLLWTTVMCYRLTEASRICCVFSLLTIMVIGSTIVESASEARRVQMWLNRYRPRRPSIEATSEDRARDSRDKNETKCPVRPRMCEDMWSCQWCEWSRYLESIVE